MIFENKKQIERYDKQKNKLRKKALEGDEISLDDGKNKKLNFFMVICVKTKEFRICAGCDKEFIPTLSKRLCRDCKTETDAVYEELMKKEK